MRRHAFALTAAMAMSLGSMAIAAPEPPAPSFRNAGYSGGRMRFRRGGGKKYPKNQREKNRVARKARRVNQIRRRGK